jgi:hypothetical protein
MRVRVLFVMAVVAAVAVLVTRLTRRPPIVKPPAEPGTWVPAPADR